jgi:Protein of unknown function (DUF4038)/Putative collagen-binding domain of a collagenase
MYRSILFCFLIVGSNILSIAQSKPSTASQSQWQKLYIQPDKRVILKGDGKPFFWLGDTAWELFHRLTREEAEEYLRNRATKGFTVIQAVALAEFDGLTQPNQYGQLPLIDNDPTKPNEAYFKHIDWVVDKANQLGLIVGLLPTWGDKINKKWGVGPEVFTPENALIYGEYLGKRYKNKGIVWILGGDRNPETEKHFAIIRAIAEGLERGDGATKLMTYHPMGGSNSAGFFHKDKWLDINMFQSGHSAKNIRTYVMQRQNYSLFPVKPTLDGEPRYEDHPIDWKPEKDYFNSHDVRQAAWWAALSGSCGHTYGNHNIWQFFDPNRNAPISLARTHWRRAMDHEGAFQVGFLKKLFESHPWPMLLPDLSILKGVNTEDTGYQIAALSDEEDFMFAYAPTGRPFKVDMSRFSATQLLAYWFNPRDGISIKIGEYTNQGTQDFKPSIASETTDWVLVIDDASKPWAGFGLAKAKQ